MKKMIITMIGVCALLTTGLITAIVFENNQNISQLIRENAEALSQIEGLSPTEEVGMGKVEKILINADFKIVVIDGKNYDCIVQEQTCVGQGSQFCAYRISYNCELSDS